MPKETVRVMKQLRKLGMSDATFMELHHFRSPKFATTSWSFDGHLAYCEAKTRFGPGGNPQTRERLKVALELVRERGSWSGVVEEAWRRCPIVCR